MSNPLLRTLVGDTPRLVARPFGTPLVIQGYTWLPVNELAAWAALAAFWAGKPGRSWGERLLASGLAVLVSFGSEWGHNFAHAAAAQAVGKPMDQMQVFAGLPRVTYFELNDRTVTPGQHILRALGGPAFNAMLWALSALLRRFTRPDSVAHDVAGVAQAANAFIAVAGALVPIPGLDGGAILKWGLVGRGMTVPQADRSVRRLNAGLAPTLGAAAVLAWRKNRLLGGLLGFLGLTALAIATGKLTEANSNPKADPEIQAG